MDWTRAGKFSSSSIWKLMTNGTGGGFGKPALSYIEEKRMERRLGRELTTEHGAKPTTWGTLVEQKVFERMDLKYQLTSEERYVHPDISEWTGCPDLMTDDTMVEIKCPYTLKSFCHQVDAMELSVDPYGMRLKESKPEYYWQIVSNAILTGKENALFIVYVPYFEDLPSIQELAREKIETGSNQFAWINWAELEEMPYLIKGKHYKDLNMWQFQIPKEDKELLTKRVEMAVQKLKE